MQSLHEKEVFHGNITSTNILFYDEGQDTALKLIDYSGFPGCSVDILKNIAPIKNMII